MNKSAALEAARRLCDERGLRFTDLRRTTFEEVFDHGPVGAYRLMALLGRRLSRRIDPPTVYRALDFLREAGLIDRFRTRGTYLVRGRPEQSRLSVLLFCEHCRSTVELEDPEIQQLIEDDATARGFRLGRPLIECCGTCERCAGTEGLSS